MRGIWVATAGGGAPDAVPVWFWWDGESVYFSTKSDSRNARNIERQPRVVLQKRRRSRPDHHQGRG
jgi:nitroimidazol reductase NimA-like FMN-containing flavoprotein (pyridoxamine 5'-phosphate oxidase superfamily)